MKIDLELAMKLDVHCDKPLEIGETHSGFRRVIPIIGGTFEGPNIKGIILPGGADWNLTRSDGTGEVLARYTLKADDGTLISVLNKGKSYEWAKRDAVDTTNEKKSIIYTTPSFEVSGEKYKWLNDSMFVGSILPYEKGVYIHFYRLV